MCLPACQATLIAFPLAAQIGWPAPVLMSIARTSFFETSVQRINGVVGLQQQSKQNGCQNC
jgi:hypothetical protein